MIQFLCRDERRRQLNESWNKWKRHAPLAVSAFVALGLLFILFLPDIFVWITTGLLGWAVSNNEAHLTAVTGARQAVLFILGGVIAVAGLIYTHWKHEVDRQNAQLQVQSSELQRDSNYTDRYTTAIQQLADEKPTIRLGGIYALERIFSDSERDRPAITDVLADFVLASSPRLSGEDEDRTPESPRDAVAALKVLGRRPCSVESGTVELGRTEYHSVVLTSDPFRSLTFMHSVWWMPTFEGSTIDNVDFSFSEFHLAEFTGSSMINVSFANSTLEGCKFVGVNFHGSSFQNAMLWGCQFIDCNVTKTDFRNADLSQTAFINGSGWDYAQLNEIRRWDHGTIWPDGVEPAIDEPA